ncbi:hypothetical protein CGLO_10439 [Colletotrichum gloeosporioides Cg-14]|uniref:Uncharacterized protein n=1 Tax=Colletotrichum gloeosporioides (strain Cg-14) TaxID=1237896 RepID=T0KDG6_COLGC|nr:hypothetical protein CGLO_10439 [Colletotrichum gloeosporioides Cg-14]
MVSAIREFIEECVSIFRCGHIATDAPRQRAMSLPMIHYQYPPESTLFRCKSFNQAMPQRDPARLGPRNISTEAVVDAEYVMETKSVVKMEEQIKSSANLPYDPLALHPVTFDVDSPTPEDAEALPSSPLVQDEENKRTEGDFHACSFRMRMVRNSAILVPTYLPPPRRLLSSPLYSIEEEDEPRNYLRGMAGRERLE